MPGEEAALPGTWLSSLKRFIYLFLTNMIACRGELGRPVHSSLTEPLPSMIRENEDTARYILDRCCPSGGFCQYQQDKPRCSDSFWACAGLELLEVRFVDQETTRYLAGLQAGDGTYPSLLCGWYAISALRALNLPPVHEPSRWVHEQVQLPPEGEGEAGPGSRFESLYLVSDLCRRFSVHLPEETIRSVEGFLAGFQEEGGGFGSVTPNLTETFHCVSVLRSFGCHVPRDDVISFISECEDPDCGLVPLPGADWSSLEDVHSGSVLCALVGYRSQALDTCRSVVHACRHESGGFSCSVSGGPPTLEHTWRALTTLRHLDYLQTGSSSRPLRTRGSPSCW